MDGGDSPPGTDEQRRMQQQFDNAIRAIQRKKPVSEVDFTLHVMEDGTQVSTRERVCKGMEAICRCASPSSRALPYSLPSDPQACLVTDPVG